MARLCDEFWTFSVFSWSTLGAVGGRNCTICLGEKLKTLVPGDLSSSHAKRKPQESLDGKRVKPTKNVISYIKPASAGDGSWRNWCQGGEGEKYGVNFANILQYRFNQTFTHIWQAEITLTQAVLLFVKHKHQLHKIHASISNIHNEGPKIWWYQHFW